ncbi:MAG: hypothetical protein ACLTAI_07295 [Thomasclavelia sp.]
MITLLVIPLIYESIFEMYPTFNAGLKEIGRFIQNNFNYDISSLTSYIEKSVYQFFNDPTVLDATIDVLNQVLVNFNPILLSMLS